MLLVRWLRQRGAIRLASLDDISIRYRETDFRLPVRLQPDIESAKAYAKFVYGYL